MTYNPDDVNTWPVFMPQILAHDVARSQDRSTAVIGGNSPFGPSLLGIKDAEELPQKLYGSSLASALMQVDARHGRNALIVADVSNDPTYIEVLFETFGPRVIGVHISRFGDGMTCERRLVRGGAVPVYPVGRTHLLELLLSEFRSRHVKFADQPTMRRAYDQLNNLEVERRDTGTVYNCLAGHHDDLAISCAMLAWAARHQHLPFWVRTTTPKVRIRRDTSNWAAGWC